MDEIVNSTVDAAVYRSDGIRVYGLDAELEKKAQAKRDQQFEQQAGLWIEELLKEKLEFPNDIIESLKSGVLLCKMINAIQPGTIKRINTKNVALMQVENITVYLKACWKLGVPSADLFVTSDLFQRKGINQVFQNILSLSRVAAAMPGYTGPKFGAKLAAPPPVKKWDTVQTTQVVYVQDLEKKKAQSSSELKQLKATIDAVKAEKEDLWNLKLSLEEKLSQQEADLELHTHKVNQYEELYNKLQQRLEELEKLSKEMEDTIAQQTKKIIVQEALNTKLRAEKDKNDEEVQRQFQEKVKAFQKSIMLQEANDKINTEKENLLREHQSIIEERQRVLKEEEAIQHELTRAKLAHIDELSSMQEVLQGLRMQITEQRELVQEEKRQQLLQSKEKEDLQGQLARVSGDLVQKAVELSEMKQQFAISKEEYESRLLANKMISSKELEGKLEEQESMVTRQKVLNKLLQANIEKMTSEKDAIMRMLDTVKGDKARVEKENLELLIDKEKQREEKLELVLANQKMHLELQSTKSALKEQSEGYQKDGNERLAVANARIAELLEKLREAEEEKRVILAEKMEVSVRAQELALDRVMMQQRVDELEARELEAEKDIELVANEKSTLEAKVNTMAETIVKMTQDNEQVVKEFIALKHACRNLKSKAQLEKSKHNEEISVWKQKHDEEREKRKSIKQVMRERKRTIASPERARPTPIPTQEKPPDMESLDQGGEKVKNMSFRKSVRYQAFTQNTMQKLMTSGASPEPKDIKRLTTLLTSDAGRRRFTMNLQSSMKENPQQVIDNTSFDTMMELFNTMLNEMDLSNAKDFMSAKVLMQTANRMTRKLPGDKVQHMQEMIKKHEVWKNTNFWEEFFWQELTKRHRKKHGTEVDHVDIELCYNLLGGFAYNMMSWGVSLDDAKKFVYEMAQRNGLTTAQADKIVDDITKLMNSAPHPMQPSAPISPRSPRSPRSHANTTTSTANTNTNTNTTTNINTNANAITTNSTSTSTTTATTATNPTANTPTTNTLTAQLVQEHRPARSATLPATLQAALHPTQPSLTPPSPSLSHPPAHPPPHAPPHAPTHPSAPLATLPTTLTGENTPWNSQQQRNHHRARNGSVIGTRRSVRLDLTDLQDSGAQGGRM